MTGLVLSIASLSISHFRNLSAIQLEPCLFGANIIWGQNGSGKTSLLEAIHYIGSGRSFRSASAMPLVQHGFDKFVLFAQVHCAPGLVVPIGMERGSVGLLRARVAEKDIASLAEIACALPIRVINSHSYHLLELGPSFRRKFLDWGLFYQEPQFLPCWRLFERALKQRNAVLRDKKPKKEWSLWTEELIRYGLKLHQFRCDYVQYLSPVIQEAINALLPQHQVAFHYQPGWDTQCELAALLERRYADEMRQGHTLFGPHRADLEVLAGPSSAKHFLSQGQKKLLICAMILGQGTLLLRHANKKLVYLVDDLPAELDGESRKGLASVLAAQKTQLFMTAIDDQSVKELIKYLPHLDHKTFHVKHGRTIEIKGGTI